MYAPAQTYQQQADAMLSQVNPVSATLYTVLATTRDVRIISLEAAVGFAAGAPDPLEIVLTIDGVTTIFPQALPGNGTPYFAYRTAAGVEAIQAMTNDNDVSLRTTFPILGKSVKVQVRVTWAVNQPTPLVCRVKYCKLV